jgi:SAM-dependent methyltransferase
MSLAQPYKIYRVDESSAPETRGRSWAGDSVSDNIQLCEYQTICPTLLKYLPKAGRILESGCGLGRWVFYLRQNGFNITGIDLAGPAIEMAKAYDPSVPIVLDDVLHSQFPDGSFAAAISLGVVEHFEEGPQRALAELHRILREDGILLISIPVQNFLRRLLTNRLKDAYRWYRKCQGRVFVFEEYRFTRGEFRSHLEDAGFEIFEVVPDDFRAPKNMGLYADYRLLHDGDKKWELNAFGKALNTVLGTISPWVVCAGAHYVCRKRQNGSAQQVGVVS